MTIDDYEASCLPQAPGGSSAHRKPVWMQAPFALNTPEDRMKTLAGGVEHSLSHRLRL